MRDVQINGLTVVDAAARSTPGLNQDGLRLENCSYVTANGVQVQAGEPSVCCARRYLGHGLRFRDDQRTTRHKCVFQRDSSQG